MFKVNNINSRRGVKYFQSQQKRHQNNARRRSGVFFVDFEHISHHVLVFLLLILNRKMPAGNASRLSLVKNFPKVTHHRNRDYVFPFVYQFSSNAISHNFFLLICGLETKRIWKNRLECKVTATKSLDIEQRSTELLTLRCTCVIIWKFMHL